MDIAVCPEEINKGVSNHFFVELLLIINPFLPNFPIINAQKTSRGIKWEHLPEIG